MIYSICKFNVEYDTLYPKLRRRSEKYLSEDQSVTPDFKISITEEEVDKHVEEYNTTRALAEYVLAGLKFYKEIISRGAFFLHSAALAVDDSGYMFTGPCGAGKSTHASLWREYFKDDVISVNDDKPAIRFFDGVPYVCGTPFSGKFDINSNTIVKLKGISILAQSPENKIERVSSAQAMPVLMEQTLRPENPADMMSLFDMLDNLLKKVPVYKLYCNISEDAVKLSYGTMKEG